jgi:glycosyltransferase involved in cell wall biosynthesis
VPTKNSEKFLEQFLESIKNQTYKNIELIVVDNNSTDKTVEIVQKFSKKSPRLDIKLFNWGPERSAQLNFGVNKTKGGYIYYTGSDLSRDADLIEQAVNKCENENFDAVYLNVLTKIKNPNIWQKVRALERELYFKEPGMSAARFYKKDIYLKVGGLDENLGCIGDDLEFQYRLNINGYKTAFIDAKENNLGEYKSLKTIITRSLYYGWFIGRYFDKHPQKTKKQYRFIRKEFIKNKEILLKNKSLFIAFLFYRIIQSMFGGTGLILSKVTKNNKKIEQLLFKLNYR